MAALFERILNISISATWLIFAVICAGLLLRRAPKWTRMLLWALVALRLILPFTLESPLSLVPEKASVTLVTDATEHERSEAISTEGQGVPLIPDSAPSPVIPNPPENGPITPSEPIMDAKPSEQAPIVDIVPKTVYTEPVKGEDKAISIGLALSIVWIAGMAIMAGYFAITYITMRVRLRDAVHGEGRVWYSDRIGEPFVFGIIRPRIYMPFSVSEKDAPHVLAHENSHIKRGDHIVKPLAFLILCVHWFNPAVWLAYLLFSRDMELACDEAVIRGMDEDKVNEYSHALVTLSTKNSFISLHPISFGGANMKNRLKNILNYKKPTLWIIIVAIILCIAVAVCFFTSPAKDKGSESTTETTDTTDPIEPEDENKEYIFKRDDAEPATISYRIQNMGNMAYPFDCLNDVTVELIKENFKYHYDTAYNTYIKNAYIGEKVTEPIPEREVVTTVTVTYSDGSSVTCDTEYIEKDGETYKVEHLSYPYGIETPTRDAVKDIISSFPGQSNDPHHIFHGFESTDHYLGDEDTVYTIHLTNNRTYTLYREDFKDHTPMFYMTTFIQVSEPEAGKITVAAAEGEKDVIYGFEPENILVKVENGENSLIMYGGDAGLCEFRTAEGSYWYVTFHNPLPDDFGYGMNGPELIHTLLYSDYQEKLQNDYNELSPGVYLKTVTGTTNAGEYTGYLMLCTDPSRVKVVDTYRQFECGEQVSSMIERAGAVAGIDGGGFVDGADYLSNGGTPYGFLIEDGIMVNEAADGYGRLVGINKKGEMVVGSYSTEEVLDLDLRSAVVAEAILIEDGKPSPDTKKGWGANSRTALGQRENGDIILLTVDGRQLGYSIGCDVHDLQSILLDEGCVNAAMIDGGASSVMETATYSDSGECTVELVNKPHLGSALKSQRYINNAWVIMPE